MGAGIQVKIHPYNNPTTVKQTLFGRRSPRCLQELKARGGGSFQLARADRQRTKDPTVLDGRNIAKVSVDGNTVGAFLIGDKSSTLVDVDGAPGYDVAGEGLKFWFDDTEVRPYGGLQALSQTERYFNFASEQGSWYKPADWITPFDLGQIGTGAWGMPEKWPEQAKNARWIWASAYASPMPFEPCYFRYSITLAAAGRYAIYSVADDIFELYVDGQKLQSSDLKDTAYRQANRVEVTLTAGAHVIAYKAQNNANFGGPAVLANAVLLINADNTETLVGNSQTSNWKALPYPAAAPGWTPGEILITLMNEAQARGVLFPTYLTKTFTATLDSYGVAWPQAIDWSFKVGESLLSVIEKMEESMVDIWIDPANLNLNMVPVRGVDRSVFGQGGSYSEIRRNIFGDPLALTTNSTWWGSTSSTPSTVVSGGKSWARFTRTVTGSVRLADMKPGTAMLANTPYRFLATVKSSISQTLTVVMRPDVAISGTSVTIGTVAVTAGVESVIDLSGTTSATAPTVRAGVAFTNPLGAIGDTIDVTNVSIELVSTSDGSVINGNMPDLYPIRYDWQSTVNGSPSIKLQAPVSQTPVEFRIGKHLRKSTTRSRTKIKNSLSLKTESGWTTDVDAASVSKYGVLEGSLDTGASEAVAKQLSKLVFAQRAQEEEGATYDFIVKSYIPFVHFDIGDWVLAPDDDGLMVKRRVMSIAVEETDAGQPVYTIEFDTIFRENEDRLNKIADKLTGGGVGSGLSNVQGVTPGVGYPVQTPPDSVPIVLKPKTPTGLNVDLNQGFWTADGVRPYGQVTLNWDDVVQYTDNTAAVIPLYQVQGTKTGINSTVDFGTVTSSVMTISNLNPGDAWTFQVRALSSNGTPSNWTSTVSATIAGPTVPMAAPSTPVLASDLGLLIVTWDGLLAGATVPPKQFRYLYAEVGTSGTGPWTRKGQVLTGPGQISIPGETVGAQRWVRFFAVDGAGILSSVSGTGGPITITGVDVGDLDPSISAAIAAAKEAGLAAAEQSNMIGDPSFELNTAEFWTLGTGVTNVTTLPRTGTRHLRLPATTTAREGFRYNRVMPCQPGDTFYFRMYIDPQTTVPDDGIRIEVMSGATTSLGTITEVEGSGALTAAGYIMVTGNWTVPAGVNFFKPRVWIADTNNTSIYFVDDFRVLKMTGVPDLVIGSVTADKIAANSIIAEHLQANSVSAEKIQALAITAEKIAASAITSDKIAANAIAANNIQAGAIQTNHLSPVVGQELNIAGNVTIVATQDAIAGVEDNLQGTQDDLATMQTYYAFGPTGAVISSPGSVFSTAIRSDRIEMLENGNVVSYWNSGTLYVNQFVGEKVTLGNHQLEKFGTGTVVRSLG